MEKEDLIYLDTYVLQRDMRIRLPKSVLENLQVTKGKTKFKIYCDAKNFQLILRKDTDDNTENRG